MTKNLKKTYSWRKKFLSKNYYLPFPMPKLQKNPSAFKREHAALQTWNFLIFSTFVGHFCPPGFGSGYGSTDLIESGSNPDPDPKHWSKGHYWQECNPFTVVGEDGEDYMSQKNKISLSGFREISWACTYCACVTVERCSCSTNTPIMSLAIS